MASAGIPDGILQMTNKLEPMAKLPTEFTFADLPGTINQRSTFTGRSTRSNNYGILAQIHKVLRPFNAVQSVLIVVPETQAELSYGHARQSNNYGILTNRICVMTQESTYYGHKKSNNYGIIIITNLNRILTGQNTRISL